MIRTGRIIGWLAWGSLAIVAGACGSGQPTISREVGDSLHLRIAAIHDFHGALTPTIYPWSGGRMVGGAATVAAVMDSAEARCACTTLRLDGGDQMQGTLESNLVHGASVVDAFNLMRLDAAAVGNHDLDWGIDTLRVRQREAQYAWLTANVFKVSDGARPDWAVPYTIINRGGLRTAVVGYSTVGTPLVTSIGPLGTKDYEFRRGFEAIRDVLAEIERLDPDFTILVAHAAGDCADAQCSGEIVDLVAEVPRGAVQLVVGGHNHEAGMGVVNSVPIVRAGALGRVVAVVDLIRHGDGRHSFQVSHDTAYADAYTASPSMQALLEPYRVRADSAGRVPITTLGETLSGLRLGDLIADAARLHEGADVGLYNPGGVRATLPSGAVSYADLYRVLPFGNTLVRVTLSGGELRQVVEWGVAARPHHFSNLSVVYDPNSPVGQRVVSVTFADGRPILMGASYSLATVDFLADGGNGFNILTALPRQSGGYQILDAVIDHVRTMPVPLRVGGEQRIREGVHLPRPQ